MPKNKSQLRSNALFLSGSMVVAHSEVYSTFLYVIALYSLCWWFREPAGCHVDKWNNKIYSQCLLYSSHVSLFSKCSSFFKRYSNSAVLFYCCVDMGEVVICTSCFLSLVRMLEEQSCLDSALPLWVGTVLCKAQMVQLWTMNSSLLYCDSTDGGELRSKNVMKDSNAVSNSHWVPPPIN